MKPEDQRSYKGSGHKVDYHVRENGKPIGNWWEDVASPHSKSKLVMGLENEIHQGIEEFEHQRAEDLEEYRKLIIEGISDL